MIIGIDLGTTNSLAAYYQENEIHMIPNSFGEETTPSSVSVLESGEIAVGKIARERAVTHPSATFQAFKRDMGTKKEFKYKISKFYPVQLSSLILQYLLKATIDVCPEEVEGAVISVPAYFNEHQRHDTIEAAKMAGINVVGLINEPTAAALAYHLLDTEAEKMVVVIDLGGGTYDVSLLDIFESIIEVKAISGDNYLGGEDFDKVIVSGICKKIGVESTRLDIKSYAKLNQIANEIKHAFDNKSEVTKYFELSGEKQEVTFTNQEFEEICEPILERLKKPIDRVLYDSGMKIQEIDEVLLVGGSTKMPLVRKLIARLFGKFPLCHIDPDQVVARGAAVYAGLRNKNVELMDIILTDVCPYTLGVSVTKRLYGGRRESVMDTIIERNMTVPVSRESEYSSAGTLNRHLSIGVYQGENRDPKKNIHLGTLEVPIDRKKNLNPDTPEVKVRFTYDANGILEVIVKSMSTGEERKEILLNSNLLSKEEVDSCMLKLENIKIHPMEAEENLYMISRAEHLYEMFLNDDRERIGNYLDMFRNALLAQDEMEIIKAKEHMLKLFEYFGG